MPCRNMEQFDNIMNCVKYLFEMSVVCYLPEEERGQGRIISPA